MDFDEPVDRRHTTSLKWDGMGRFAGADGADLLAMWVADMDFRAAPVVCDALAEMSKAGLLGYMSDLDAMRAAVAWWMKTRHDWEISDQEVLTTHGLGNALALAIGRLTEPGDGVVLFTPVYHEFAGRVNAAGRRPVEVPMSVADGRQEFDLDRAAAMLDGTERLMIVCSPQNPGGRVWSTGELEALGDFADRHGLFVLADEIHHDLVYPGHRFVPMEAVTDLGGRLLTITAPSKTFNTPGLRVGHMIVRDPALRRRLVAHLGALGIQPNMAGVVAATAAYSPDGAAWADALVTYLDGNRQLFEAGINAIPGVRAMALEATFLAWVDFSGTGMDQAEIEERVLSRARIVANPGPSFGPSGEGHMRFNLGTQRARVEKAVGRLQRAFADLQ
ncbi:MAG: PatB family C-S lyase [Paracoccaceae bacterium]|nr:PatB family C-S lyase [Paracoccaceae bacterium]